MKADDERKWMDCEGTVLHLFKAHIVFPKSERGGFNGRIQTSTRGCIQTAVAPRTFAFCIPSFIKK